ncbi:MAG: GntR family transcriptional regulator [Eubacteriales bacterium]
MFSIDPMARKPVYEQIIDQTEKFILTGALSPGDQLPSVRSLSLELTINPNTILKSYSDLDNRGIIQSVPGKGYFVCAGAKSILADRYRLRLTSLRQEIAELAMAGIGKEELLSLIEKVYENNEITKKGNDSHD